MNLNVSACLLIFANLQTVTAWGITSVTQIGLAPDAKAVRQLVLLTSYSNSPSSLTAEQHT